jgi:signal transduction histidine kinase
MNVFADAFDIAKIKIYNVESQVIYSTDTKIIGQQDPYNKSLQTALAGTPISKHESKDKVWDLDNEEHLDIDAIETYIPVYGPDGVIIGSFEIYKDIAKDLRMADTLLIRSWSVLAVTVLGVFSILMFVIHRAIKTIKISTGNLVKTNGQLQQEIADRKRLEKELLGIVEQERQRIGQELHDSIGQQLTGVAFMAEKLGKRLSRKSLTEEIKYAERIGTCISLAAEQTRNLAKELHPIDLDRNGLIPAIEELAENTEKLFNISCVTKCEKNISISNITVTINLYRIAQEAITNAVKHGKARNIKIELATGNSHLKLVVENDGISFSTERSNGKGMGLRVMQYRAESINGSLDIRKGANGGTIITCILPKKEPLS